MDKNQLLLKIQELGFVLDDVLLFLDTHPNNKIALDFYKDNKAQYEQYRHQFEQTYGPLSPLGVDASIGWTWIQGPWPWERQA